VTGTPVEAAGAGIEPAEAASARIESAAAGETASPFRWVVLAVLWVAYIVVFLNRLGVGPLGAFFKDDLRISSAQVGLVMSAAALGFLLTQIPIGWVADRIGARWPMVIGELIAGAAMTAVYLTPSYPALLMCVFVTGAGCGFLAPSTTQAVILWFPRRERATVMGVKQTAVNLGGIIGAAVLPAVALSMGWRAGFLLLGLTAIAAAILTLLVYPDAPRASRSTGRAAGPVEVVPLLRILANRQIWLVAAGAFFLNWAEMAMIGHFVIYATKVLLLPVVAAGGLLAVAEAAGAVARPASGLVSDWIFDGHRKGVFIFFPALTSILCAVLAFSGPRLGWLLYPAVFLLGVGAIGFGGVYLTLLSELGGRGGAAKAAGLGSTIAVGGSILGPPAFGHIVDVSGSYQLAWLSLAAAAAVSVFFLLFVDESRRTL
jgi:MFS transporter, ACS family, aldohexuronate transporter